MEEFKGNSKLVKKELQEKPRVEPVTSQVTVKKPNELKKFGHQLFSEDAKTVGGHIFTSVVIPSIQKLISDAVKNGIDWIIYGVKGASQGGSGIRNISYSSFYNRNKVDAPVIPSSAYKRNNIYMVNDVIFDDRGEAEEVLMRLREAVDVYKSVSVGDFYDMIGQKWSFTDQRYGWVDLNSAEVIRTRDGYSIQFPKVTPLE